MSNVKNLFLRLNIYRDKLDDAIADYFMSREEDCEYNELIAKGGDRHRLIYKVNGKEEMLDFRFNQDGTTSIDLSSGVKTQFKEQLAESIRTSSICTEPAMVGYDKSHFIFKGISQTDFEQVLKVILEDQEIEIPQPLEVSGGKRWVVKGIFGDQLTITYYFASKKVMLQGKPLKLFMEFHTYLMTLFDSEDIPKILESNHIVTSSEFDKTEIEEELETYIPHAMNKIHIKIKKMLCQALYNLKINDNQFEFAQFTFPALKALEGHMKHIMYDKKIPLNDGRLNMFKTNTNGKYVLYRNEDIIKFTQSECAAINDAYHFYNVNRHSLFHWDEIDQSIPVVVDSTRLLERADEAHGIIKNVLNIVDNYYK